MNPEIKLVKEDDPVLRQDAKDWDFAVDGNPNNLIREMSKIMLENNGIGLAAPQIGLSKRLFVMGNETKLYAIINPQVIEGIGSVKDQEGCLSFPNLWLNVTRYEKIKVKYFNALGEEIITEFAGLIARVFLHELDHLDGICFDTKVGKLSLEMAQNRRKKRLRKSFY
jgi:peptide deformylase